MQLSEHHKIMMHGVGKCSVPMWTAGCPSGFCDRLAYGVRPSSTEYRDGYGHMRPTDNLYDGYVPALACHAHGGPLTPEPFKDGDMWCVLTGKNLQEGVCGFGNTPELAQAEFLAAAGV